MNSLWARALMGFFKLFVVLGLGLFIPAWTVDFWEAWAFIASFFIPVLLITIYFVRRAPDLIERRLKAGPSAEERTSQKVIQSLASLFFVLLVLVPAFLVITGDVIVLLGLVMVFYVFKANTFTSSVIELAARQQVISTGPYALVRHPMYSGGLLVVFAMPIALGSWWGFPLAFGLLVAIVLRLFDEETMLLQNRLVMKSITARSDAGWFLLFGDRSDCTPPITEYSRHRISMNPERMNS